jgi:hypothetical protein
MAVNDIPLLITGVALLVFGTGLMIYWAKKGGYFNFLRINHYYALIFFVIAGIMTWFGLVFPINPEKFEVNNKQWVALGFSIIISFLWWGRYIYSISPNTELVEEIDED